MSFNFDMDKPVGIKVDSDLEDTGEKDWDCRYCGVRQKGAWHHCSGCFGDNVVCSLSFVQLAGFDAHRIGEQGHKRHMTPEELAADPDTWTQDDTYPHLWHYHPKGNNK